MRIVADDPYRITVNGNVVVMYEPRTSGLYVAVDVCQRKVTRSGLR